MERVTAGDRHDTALGVDAGSRWEQAGIVDVDVIASAELPERIRGTSIALTHWTGGKQMYGHER